MLQETHAVRHSIWHYSKWSGTCIYGTGGSIFVMGVEISPNASEYFMLNGGLM